jgi:hypothetical protein
MCPARMRPALDQPPEFLLFYFIYIIPFTFKYNYSFDQQELLIRLSLILVLALVTQEPGKSGAQHHVTPHLT